MKYARGGWGAKEELIHSTGKGEDVEVSKKRRCFHEVVKVE